TRKALLVCLSRTADASYQHSILHQTILSFGGSKPQARSGSSSPIWAVNPPSCWIPTISCVTFYSSNPIRFRAHVGIGRSLYGTCRYGSARSLGARNVFPERPDDDVIDNDLILVWGSQRRIITGSDLLGRLLRGIATVEAGNAAHQSG